jgi:hypothetical protein
MNNYKIKDFVITGVGGWVTLKGGAEAWIDSPEKKSSCKKCNAIIIWGVSRSNKWMPLVKDGEEWVSHFSNCPGAKEFRK